MSTDAMSMDDLQKALLDERNASELTRGEELPATGVRRSRTRSQVFSIRLDPNDLAAIEAIARKMDVPVSALIRGWVLRGMTEHGDGSLSNMVERLRVDIDRLQELLG
jgi:Ribbon-helix-helix protein, copG family